MLPTTASDPVAELLNRPVTAHWSLSFYPDAREAGGGFVPSRPNPHGSGVKGQAADPVRARVEAARRAKGKLRRYCAANRLNRLGTLTYRGAGCHDQREVRTHVGAFFRALRVELDGKPIPYAWVPEWHKTDHGLHLHFAVGRFIPRSLIAASWPHGFVHIKVIGDLPVGSGTLGEARKAAGYLSKYVAKSFADDARIDGLHRYDLAQGFQPRVQRITDRSPDAVINEASRGSARTRFFGGPRPTFPTGRAARRSGRSGPDMPDGQTFTPEEVENWVRTTCAAQGVPVKVADPVLVGRVGALLGSGRRRMGGALQAERARRAPPQP